MAPDTIPLLFFISGSFGSEGGGNVLWLKKIWIFRFHRHHLRVSPSFAGSGPGLERVILLDPQQRAVGYNSGRQYS
jgi:hypothetical protein